MSYYDAGDAAINYETTGDGFPLILLHGYALNGFMWNLQKPVFAKTHQVITIDLRGFGDSSCGKRWSGSVMAEDVSGLIESLGLQDITIAGFSMSGPVAVRLAIEKPDVVKKLILVSSILPSSGRPKARRESELQRRERDILRLRGPLAWTEAMGLRDGLLIKNTFRRNPMAIELWEEMLSRHHADYLLCMLEARLETPSLVDWRSRLPEVSQPTLVVAGAQDDRFIDASRRLANDIPNARFEIISGAGHMVNIEEPERFNEVVREFFKDTAG